MVSKTPGGHGIGRDPKFAELERERLAQRVYTGLADDVMRTVGDIAGKAVDPGDVDDAAPAACLHARNHRAGEVEARAEVGIEGGVPVINGDVEEGLLVADRDIGD